MRSTAVDENFASAQTLAKERLDSEVKWLKTDEERRKAQSEVDALLSKPLSADDAVRISLAYSPALQAMLFEGAGTSAAATQSARLPNPVFTFERLVRDGNGATELEIGRMLGISLLDLFLLPSRLRMADYRQQQARLKLSGDVVQTAIEARQAWVRAVAAQQSLQYFEQVKASADASAELARRMQAVGNFSKLQRAREQAFAADAVAQLARARQNAAGMREALIRVLGPERGPGRSPQAARAAARSAQGAQGRTDRRAGRCRSAPGRAHGPRRPGGFGTRARPDARHQLRQRLSHRGRAQQRDRQAHPEGLRAGAAAADLRLRRCRAHRQPGALHGRSSTAPRSSP